MKIHAKQQVEASRKAFDALLHTPRYREVHGDSVQLDRLLQFIDGKEDTRLLDLGTGDGYVAFEMATRWPKRPITGLDVAREAIARNRLKAEELGLTNTEFHTYEGRHFPFLDGIFSGAVCRYAFHHCPDPEVTVSELARVLDTTGFVVLSDPVPWPPDDGRFIDEFQRLQPDGHHCFHPEESLISMFDKAGFDLVDAFESSITCPRKLNAQYEALLARTSKTIRAAYRFEVEDESMTFTLKILNHLFKKRR